MKYIKPYNNINENKPFLIEDTQTLEEICYDITDDGEYSLRFGTHFSGGIGSNFQLKGGSHNYIEIEKSNNTSFNTNEIKNTLQRIKNYLGVRFEHFTFRKSVKFGIENSNQILECYISSIYIWFQSENVSECLNGRFDSLAISDDEGKTIEEICYDITDDGFSIEVDNYESRDGDVYYLDKKIPIYNFVWVHNRNIDFNPIEIKDTLQRLKSFFGNKFSHFSFLVRDDGFAGFGINRHKIINSLSVENVTSRSVAVWFKPDEHISESKSTHMEQYFGITTGELDDILIEFVEEFEFTHETRIILRSSEDHISISFKPINTGKLFDRYFNDQCEKIVTQNNDKDFISKIMSEMQSQLGAYGLTVFHNGRFTLDVSWSLITLDIYKKEKEE